jgi:hypothetical protein
VFEGYFLAIAATCLRYDPRICVAAGALAVVQYLAISVIANTFWQLNETDLYAPFIYGAFSWSSQVSRIILILFASLLSAVVVMRTQELLRLSTWDTGHQVYPHKLITGRYPKFGTMRTKGGLMGYPNPEESDYDLFMTGHAGASVSTALGLASGDALIRPSEKRWSVAVIGDGAFPSGIVYEALNNASRFGKRLLIILNDNKMSICPRVGGMADYLDRLRMHRVYSGLKEEVVKVLNKVPLLGDPVERFLAQLKEGAKAGLHGGMLFEDLGLRYFGPIDGHNIGLLRKYLRMVRNTEGPILLHVVTEKGHGFQPAAADPVLFHAPPQFERRDDRGVQLKKSSARTFTHAASAAIFAQLSADPRVTVITAAMCQGNKLERIRETFPDRFFDTGICEGHAVALAAGQAKAGLRPIVDIYSTFLQRSYDQIFQEVTLQNLPVTFMLDRAGQQARVRFAQPLLLHRLVDGEDDLVGAGGRLGQEVVRAQAEGADRGAHVLGVGSREQDDLGTDGAAFHGFEEPEAVHLGHAQVRDDDVELGGVDAFQGLDAVVGLFDHEAGAAQVAAHHRAHDRRVVHDENAAVVAFGRLANWICGHDPTPAGDGNVTPSFGSQTSDKMGPLPGR